MLTSRKKLLSLVLPVCLMIGTLASLVFFWERYEHHHGRQKDVTENCDFPCYIGKRLNLSKTQCDSIAKIDGLHHQQIHDQFEAVNKSKQALVGILAEASPEPKLKIILDNIGAQQMRLDSLGFYNFKQMREVCTNSQKGEFDKLIKEILEKWGRRK